MMKNTLLTFGLLFGFISAFSQNNPEIDSFQKYSDSLNKKLRVDVTAKDYTASINLLKEWKKNYNGLKPEVKHEFSDVPYSLYYNLACYTALSGDQNTALNYLDTAINKGYDNYFHLIADTDLNGLHANKRFKTLAANLRERKDYGYILKKSGPYSIKDNRPIPAFTYQDASTPELVKFKTRYNLDSISGNGDEISKMKNLLLWVHNTVRHDGSSNNPKQKNAIDLIEICKKENRGVNCRMLSTILKDAYQAEGLKTRIVTCSPKDTTDFDCHVITAVWSNTLNKWLWMDPTNNAYISDEKGNLLSIEEVRTKLVKNEILIVNENANWNNKRKVTKDDYLDSYMSKNLYWIECSIKSEWDIETRAPGSPAIEYVSLYPGSFSTIGGKDKRQTKSMIDYATNNPQLFWQKPNDK